MTNEKIGNFIRQKRKEKNLTQKDLADKLGISDKAISKWERGICCPDISLLKDLSSILDISINELLSGENIETLEKVKTDKVLLDSVNKYTKIEKKKRLKLWILTLGVIVIDLVFIFIMYLMYNQINSKDGLTINSLQNRYFTDKFLTLTENKEYQKIANIGDYYFDETKCNLEEDEYDYICMLKELNDLGVEFISHKNINNRFDNLDDISEYEIEVTYQDKKQTILISISTYSGNFRFMYFDGFKINESLTCRDLYYGLASCYNKETQTFNLLYQLNLDNENFFPQEIHDKIINLFSPSEY